MPQGTLCTQCQAASSWEGTWWQKVPHCRSLVDLLLWDLQSAGILWSQHGAVSTTLTLNAPWYWEISGWWGHRALGKKKHNMHQFSSWISTSPLLPKHVLYHAQNMGLQWGCWACIPHLGHECNRGGEGGDHERAEHRSEINIPMPQCHPVICWARQTCTF